MDLKLVVIVALFAAVTVDLAYFDFYVGALLAALVGAGVSVAYVAFASRPPAPPPSEGRPEPLPTIARLKIVEKRLGWGRKRPPSPGPKDG